ncbi:transcriptional regulator [Rhodobacteraceae bacterium KLH11]|nr:transcriptional regulator [Rhodobacteraceae bacterium KLH11]
MPRPSLKDTRTQQILDAFMRCVARFGLDGSTLARISEEAGVARPLLRHYLGNREEMVQKLLDHVMQVFANRVEELFAALPSSDRTQAMMEALFGRSVYSSENAAVFAALVAASERYGALRDPLQGFVYDFEARVAAEIAHDAPTANTQDINVAAAGITAIYFNTDAIMPLKPRAGWRDTQRAAAQMLLDRLHGGALD